MEIGGIMSNLFDDLCKIIEKVDPSFDRNDQRDLDIMTKSFILAMQNQPEGKELKESYMKDIVERIQKEKVEKTIKEHGSEHLKYELAKLNLEKEILEKKLEITKKYLN